MNMHGFITPAQSARPSKVPLHRRVLDQLRARRPFLLVVVLPLAILAAYYYLIASDQYATEAHYTIESSEGGGAGSTSSIGDILGFTGSMTPSQSQAVGLADYLDSQDAVNAINSKLDLAAIFHRSDVDPLSRLKANPTAEELLHFYQGKVHVRYNKDSGISTLEVRTFTPGDSYKLARDILQLGERRVNELNERSDADGVRSAKIQYAQAEQFARETESDLTAYRQTHADINPETSGTAQTSLVSTMTASLSIARAQLAQMGSSVSKDSPQYRAMASHVAAMETEVARQSGRLTGQGSTIASRLGGYEELSARQQFAQKQFEAAAANLDKANEATRRQNLYLVRVVEPTVPTQAEYPRRARILGTALLILLVGYAIGWLVVAGVREHSL